MQTKINASADFSYAIHLQSVQSMPGMYLLRIESQWTGARDPEDRHNVAQITLDEHAVRQLRDLFTEVVGQPL